MITPPRDADVGAFFRENLSLHERGCAVAYLPQRLQSYEGQHALSLAADERAHCEALQCGHDREQR
jgi:hypothetical protein